MRHSGLFSQSQLWCLSLRGVIPHTERASDKENWYFSARSPDVNMLKYLGEKTKTRKKNPAVLRSLTQAIELRLLLFFHLDRTPRSPARFRYITEGMDENVLSVKRRLFSWEENLNGILPLLVILSGRAGLQHAMMVSKGRRKPWWRPGRRTLLFCCRHDDAGSSNRSCKCAPARKKANACCWL